MRLKDFSFRVCCFVYAVNAQSCWELESIAGGEKNLGSIRSISMKTFLINFQKKVPQKKDLNLKIVRDMM